MNIVSVRILLYKNVENISELKIFKQLYIFKYNFKHIKKSHEREFTFKNKFILKK